MEHNTKFMVLYWLKDKKDLDLLKETVSSMKTIDALVSLDVGTPSSMVDHIVDASYDVAAIFTMRSTDDFPAIFGSPEHQAASKVFHDILANIKGYVIEF